MGAFTKRLWNIHLVSVRLLIQHRRTSESALANRPNVYKRIWCKFKYDYRNQSLAIMCTQCFLDRLWLTGGFYWLTEDFHCFFSFFFATPSFSAITSNSVWILWIFVRSEQHSAIWFGLLSNIWEAQLATLFDHLLNCVIEITFSDFIHSSWSFHSTRTCNVNDWKFAWCTFETHP